MLIDWFTVISQVVNFLILVWLMKKFLYKPILDAIEARENKIAAELADADKKKLEAKQESDEFKNKNEEIDKQRASLLVKAREEANAESKRLQKEAREAADDLSTNRKETLRNDINNLNQRISQRMQEEVFSVAQKVLTDLSGISLEERMVEVFISHLHELDEEVKNNLCKSLAASADQLFLVRSAFDLSSGNRAAIQNALNIEFSVRHPAKRSFASDVDIKKVGTVQSTSSVSKYQLDFRKKPIEAQIRFETKPGLISGIELIVNGQKLAWSIGEYLVSLENSIGALVDSKNI